MTQKHTPGPWVGSRHPSDMRGHTVIRKADCTGLIGTVYRVQDAALIAAAPDLLAALRALHACHRAFSIAENWTALDDDSRAMAEAAIAKAEGRS